MPELPITGTRTIGTTPSVIAGRTSKKRTVVITNNGTQSVFLSSESDVSTTTGYELLQGNSFNTRYQEQIYGVCSASGGKVSVWDERY